MENSIFNRIAKRYPREIVKIHQEIEMLKVKVASDILKEEDDLSEYQSLDELYNEICGNIAALVLYAQIHMEEARKS